MKALAICLEVFVEINEAELKGIKEGGLSHVLRFSNNVSPDEQDNYIPLELKLVPNQEEDLKVEQYPRGVYFGTAESISFLINQEFYDILAERYSNGQRFSHGGKLIIRVK